MESRDLRLFLIMQEIGSPQVDRRQALTHTYGDVALLADNFLIHIIVALPQHWGSTRRSGSRSASCGFRFSV